jgi:hypothetical protein
LNPNAGVQITKWGANAEEYKSQLEKYSSHPHNTVYEAWNIVIHWNFILIYFKDLK